RCRRWNSAFIGVLLAAGAVMLGNLEAVAQDEAVEQLVARDIKPGLPTDGIGGAAVAVRVKGRTLFFNRGWADVAQRRPVTSDSLFNLASLRKAFEATVLAQAFMQAELAF